MTAPAKPFDVVAQLGPLARYALTLTRDPAAAEDLVQETLVRAYAKRALFKAQGDLRAWLFSILHNTFVSSHRRLAAEARRDQAAAGLAPPAVPPDQEQAAQLAGVRAALQALPLDQRAVIHLVTIEGLSYQEAADALGTPVGTVMSRLSRARAALRAQVAGEAAPARRALRLVGGTDEP
jgi:RNA polymerase sigma-70 factor (ECF subfamily)